MTTSQARHLIAALKDIGLPRSEFKVRTMSHIVRDSATGVSWREYDDAIVIDVSRRAAEMICQRAAELTRDHHLSVYLYHWDCGHYSTGTISSSWNPDRKPSTINFETPCFRCRG